MRHKTFSIIATLLLLMITSCRKKPDAQQLRNALINSTLVNFQQAMYAAKMDSVFSKYDFNGSISVFQDGNLLYEKQQGFEDFKQKTTIDSSTVFAIASLSKQFTAVLILLQQEEGKLSVNDKVSTYLADFQNITYQDITVHQLLTHTSGISDFGNGLLSKPGEKFSYSNKGYRFLGELIEEVSGRSFDENAAELFAKAGMHHTFTPKTFDNQNFGSAYTGNAAQYSIVENMPARLAENSISTSAGGILSTVNDLNRWNLALFGGKILKPESLKLLTKKYASREHEILGNVGYGYGIMLNLTAPEAFFHTGYVKGSPSLNIFYPKTKTSVIILSNIADERKSKNGFFQPHKEMKTAADAVELAAEKVRSEMIKKVAQ
ncbi:CubicO group peptidase, beta-lactamase class C family [Cruoricaptor ignavus]|uniref:CubicO group peptidase, beta-lactamase class C family n=2 Tax=Cruoricaptor ignavus TaxID=1118202 RepID=A0A1M6CWM8_9FLAO|nr:CubicO group peptidase, beta-lactamase class C family [Cruoricaptor ignavus]